MIVRGISVVVVSWKLSCRDLIWSEAAWVRIKLSLDHQLLHGASYIVDSSTFLALIMLASDGFPLFTYHISYYSLYMWITYTDCICYYICELFVPNIYVVFIHIIYVTSICNM